MDGDAIETVNKRRKEGGQNCNGVRARIVCIYYEHKGIKSSKRGLLC
jgi:hypothetical protein